MGNAGRAARRQLVGGAVVFMLFSALMGGGATAGSAVVPAGFKVFCASHPAECRGGGAALVTLDDGLMATLKKVNSRVNASIRPVKSEKVDTWSLNVRQGDCEDYVLTKRRALIDGGVPASALAIVYALNRGEGHAVLGVRTDKGIYVLDNLSSKIKPIGSTGYTVISMSGSDPKVWGRA